METLNECIVAEPACRQGNTACITDSIDNSLQSTDNSLQNTDNSLESTDNSLQNTDNSLQSTDNSLESTDNSLQSTDNSLQSIDNSLQSIDNSLQSTDNSLQSTANSLQSIDNSLQSIADYPEISWCSLLNNFVYPSVPGIRVGGSEAECGMFFTAYSRFSDFFGFYRRNNNGSFGMANGDVSFVIPDLPVSSSPFRMQCSLIIFLI